MDEIKFFKPWVIYFLASIFFGVVGGAIGGGIIGFALGILRFPMNKIVFITGPFGLVVGAIVSYYCYEWTITKYIIPQITPSQDLNEDQANYSQK